MVETNALSFGDYMKRIIFFGVVAYGLLGQADCLAKSSSVLYNFDDYAAGEISGQHGWKLVSGNAASYTVLEDAGSSGQPGDQALSIQFEGPGSKVAMPDVLSWKPGETWSIDFDFKLQLDAAAPRATRELLALVMGGPGLADKGLWAEALGAEADGQWFWLGGAPDRIVEANQPAATFLERPDSGCADSDWFHLRFTTSKRLKRGVFESVLIVTDHSGKIVQHRRYNTYPDEGANSIMLWNLKKMSGGFTMGSASPNGSVLVDNIKIESKPLARSFSCSFDALSDGPLAGQENWVLLGGTGRGFVVEAAPEATPDSGNKALRMDFDTPGSTILAPAALNWTPGRTWSLDFDFKLELAAGRTRGTTEMLTLLAGSSELEEKARWMQSLAIHPDGNWGWLGAAPDTQLESLLADHLFLVRPSQDRSQSPWFHLSFSSKKGLESNQFISVLKISRDSEILLQQNYITTPVETVLAANVWDLKSMRFGFSQGKGAPNGSVWIDNIEVTSLAENERIEQDQPVQRFKPSRPSGRSTLFGSEKRRGSISGFILDNIENN